VRMYRGGALMTSWEKGKDERRIEFTEGDNFIRFEDVGEEWDVRVKWRADGKTINRNMDSDSLRELASELLQMADIVDTRAGRPLPKDPLAVDSVAAEFMAVMDPRPEKK